MKIPKKKVKWVAVTLVVLLAAAGGLMAWAAPPESKEDVEQTTAEPVGSNAAGGVAVSSVPAPTPRAIPRIVTDAELIGTAVVEGGSSLALFQLAGGPRFVREGDEIVAGLRLVLVGRDRVDVERDGVQQQIRLGSGEGDKQIRPGSIRGKVTEADVERLWEYRNQKFLAARELRNRRLQ